MGRHTCSTKRTTKIFVDSYEACRILSVLPPPGVSMAPTPRPTDAELAILRVLWDLGPSTVRHVFEDQRCATPGARWRHSLLPRLSAGQARSADCHWFAGAALPESQPCWRARLARSTHHPRSRSPAAIAVGRAHLVKHSRSSARGQSLASRCIRLLVSQRLPPRAMTCS